MPNAEVWHIGLYRDERTLKPVEYYNKLPVAPTVKVCLVLDPMLATGGSAVATDGCAQTLGGHRIKFVGLLGAPEGVEANADKPIRKCRSIWQPSTATSTRLAISSPGLAMQVTGSSGPDKSFQLPRRLAPDGGRRWRRPSTQPLRKKLTMDLSKRDTTPANIKDIQTKALAAAANGIVITDRNGIIIWANPSVCRLTGYSLIELIGQRPVSSSLHDDSFYQEMWDTILAGKVWRGNLINRRERWFVLS